MRKTFKSLCAASLLVMACSSFADKLWQENLATPDFTDKQLNASAESARYISFHQSELQKLLLTDRDSASLQFIIPTPDGRHLPVTLVEDSIMAPELAAKFPGIKSFKVADAEGNAIGRFSFSHKGLRGMYLYNNQWAFIDPLFVNQTQQYLSYFRKDALRLDGSVIYGEKHYHDHSHHHDHSHLSLFEDGQSVFDSTESGMLTGDSIRVYRLAVATTGEYTQFHGGTTSDGLAAVNDAINRINQVFISNLAVRFELVAGNDEIIFTNADTDPFNNDDGDIELNQEVVDSAIGFSNYDIGHILNTSGGGLAALRSVCSSSKAQGLTGLPTPTGDRFYVDFVAHEIGHQVGGQHSFNGTAESCGGVNRNGSTAWEPGSGSTVMGYASICGSQNLQMFADDFFHIGSIEEIREFIDNSNGGTCGTEISINNTQPTISAGQDYTIPARTPFVLTGEGSDDDGDTLTYNWEQLDTGAASFSPETMVDNGTRPLFRSWPGTSEPVRYFPRLNEVLANTTVIGETYPTTSRTMNFRLTAKDGKGGVATDAMQLTTIANNIGFSLLQPSSAVSWSAGGHGILVWNPAGSAEAPVSCRTVDVELSDNGGNSFVAFASNISNDGVAVLAVPTMTGDRYRLKLNCSDNVFFAVHQADFTVADATDINDSDNDGLPDDWETENGFDPNDALDASQDADSDGLSNLEEYLLSLDPNSADSDGDGVGDLDDVTGNSASGSAGEPELTRFSFESGSELTGFDLGTQNSWATTTAEAFDGLVSLASPDIGDDQSASFSYTGEFVTGPLLFYAKVSSEESWDHLEFYIDNELHQQWSGELDWFLASLSISAGEHTLTWQYKKDGSLSGFQDMAWIDLVSLPLVSPPDPDPDPDPEPEPTPESFVAYDYDGDRKADIGVRRPANFHQYIRNSSDNALRQVLFGRNSEDIPVSGDFDGDKIADIAVRRPSNQFFYIRNSSDGEIQRFNFGRNAADIPVPADYDGDGITDVAVRRPSNQFWYIRNSSGIDPITGNADGITRIRFGQQEGDIPVVADFDGDGKADLAVRRPSNQFWYIRNSSGIDPITDNPDGITRIRFGVQEADIPVPADYDGDGKADVAVRRPADFTWYIRNSRGVDPVGENSDGVSRVVFGRNSEDIPIPADYDGDGKADVAVRRPSNFFQYVLRSTDRGITRLEQGKQVTDIPLAAPILTKMAMAAAASNSGN